MVVYAGSEESALGHDLLGKVIHGLREGLKAGTPDLLLADARETLVGSGEQSPRAASRRDVRRAVLLAAIASEVKVKDTLRQKTQSIDESSLR